MDEHIDVLIPVILLAGIVPLYFYKIENEIIYYFSIKYLTLPIFVTIFFLHKKYMPNFYSISSYLVKGFVLLFYSLLLAVNFGGQMIFINALIGKQTEYSLQGTIVELREGWQPRKYGPGSPVYYVIVDDQGKSRKLEIEADEFSSYKLGDIYKKNWYEGSLGFIYQKKY